MSDDLSTLTNTFYALPTRTSLFYENNYSILLELYPILVDTRVPVPRPGLRPQAGEFGYRRL